jgi:hypothetical protein
MSRVPFCHRTRVYSRHGCWVTRGACLQSTTRQQAAPHCTTPMGHTRRVTPPHNNRLALTLDSPAVALLAEQPPVWAREASWREQVGVAYLWCVRGLHRGGTR